MGTNAGQAPVPPTKLLNEAYSDLLDDLRSAFFAAGTPNDVKDRIRRTTEMITAVIDDLDVADLSARNAAYARLETNVADVNTQLKTLQEQIDGIVDKINTATSI